MIVIKQNSTEQVIKPTIFPDGTSQVWQLDLASYEKQPVKIIWQFEQEAELIWLNQLISLITAYQIEISELFIPYLPYARQDKEIANNSTFAKEIFLKMLFTELVTKVSTLDVHSASDQIISYSPAAYIEKAITIFQPTVLVFPDESAYARYATIINISRFEIMVLEKVRNQETGCITALTLDSKNTTPSLVSANNNQAYNMLIIDDICDGGATFINTALFLHSRYTCEVAMYVTHGIFSKGFEKLISAGISKFYTTQSLIKNVAAFEIDELKNDI